jgi:hypothetical protein
MTQNGVDQMVGLGAFAYDGENEQALSGEAADRLRSDLTPKRTAMLVAFATLVWFLAALFIRFAGPAGIFDGAKGLALYGLTMPATIPLNARTRKIAGLPRRRIVTAIAVTSATATMLDGVAMSLFPQLYGDPVAMRDGAVWLLWAIGVGLMLALVTSAGARDHDR